MGADIRSAKLGDLEVFLMVARTLSYTRAAEALFTSESVVFRRIQALESHLELDLFVKSGRGITLTRQGETLLTLASHIFECAVDLENLADRVRAENGTRFVIGADFLISRAEDFLLPRAVAAFREEHPSVEVHVETYDYIMPGHAEALLDKVANGTIDVAFFSGSAADQIKPRTGLTVSPWIQQPLCLSVGSSHFAKMARETQEVGGNLVIFTLPGSGAADGGLISELAKSWAPLGLELTLMELPSPEAIKSSAIAGEGIALMRRTFVEPELRSGVLRLIPSIVDSIYVSVLIAARASQSASVATFLRFIHSYPNEHLKVSASVEA